MSYDVGSYIDLSYINKKTPTVQKKTDSQEKETGYWPGTKVVFLNWVSDIQKISVTTPPLAV